VRVDRDIALTEKKRADIVNSGRVVSMLVGKQNSIQAFDGVTKHLLPEIRPAIHHQIQIVHLDQYRNPEALIARI
jgi:hypothetical protein